MQKILLDKYGKVTASAIEISGKLGINPLDLEDRRFD